MDKKHRKRKHAFYFGRQCRFQIFGRRCQQKIDECSGMHKLNSRYCEFHQREEFLHECEFLTDSNQD